MMRRWWIVLLVLLAPLAQAVSPSAGSGVAVHAFLDRSHVSLGDTVTLNIQSSGPPGAPDLTPLEQDFQVLGTSNSSSVQIGNGNTVRTTQLGIALKPLHAGTITIPALDVGGAKTQPLTLQVGTAPSGGSGQTGDPVFMETSTLSSSPYVGEQTVYTVRLFYLPDVREHDLSYPSADGASLIKLDRDHRYTVDRNGYAYNVIEYSWALIPQRAGTITVHGPTFQGQRLAVGNPGVWLNSPNALLNGQVPGFGAPVSATAPVTRIDARAAPARAGKPWLPARDVQLKLTGIPANGEVTAGIPLTVTLSISATGQPADALPEPELPAIAGARVYPDQTRDSTDDSGQWLQGTRTRNFAIVPQREGKLSLPAITLNWWDVAQNRAEQASVPARTLLVSGAVAVGASTAAPSSSAASSAAAPAAPAAPTTTAIPLTANTQPYWRVIALASLVLWLLVIAAAAMWWLMRRKAQRVANHATPVDTARAAAMGTDDPPKPQRALQAEALEAARSGDAAACEHALLAWARASRPDMATVAALCNALSDPAQRDALDALQRARWQGGDAAAACSAVASAFAHGFLWRADEKSPRAKPPDLPPLYPS